MNIETDPTEVPPEEPQSSEAAPEEASSESPRFDWEYRTEFRITSQMREVVKLTKAVAESEIERLRRKLEKLTYGS